MLNWTERIIRMRKEVPEIGNSVVFVHNLSDSPREVAFSVPGGGEDARSLVNLLSRITVAPTPKASIICCSKPMAIDGIERADVLRDLRGPPQGQIDAPRLERG